MRSNWYYADPGRNIMRFVMRELWAIWSKKKVEDLPRLSNDLLEFNFSEYDCINGTLEVLSPLNEVSQHVTEFLCVLNSWVRSQLY